MPQNRFRRAIAVVLATGLVIGAGGIAARADVIADSPSLPVLDNPYVSILGTNCFSGANVCIGDGSVRLITPVSSIFGADQDITSDAIFTGDLSSFTTHTPLGTITLTGSIEQLVLGRGSDTDTGTWATEIEALSLSGPALGSTLHLTLDPTPSTPSTGTTSVVPFGEGQYRINSFFDVYVDLQLDNPNLTAQVGPIEFDLQPAPEPASLALLAPPLLALAIARRRQAIGASIQRS